MSTQHREKNENVLLCSADSLIHVTFFAINQDHSVSHSDTHGDSPERVSE